MSSDEFQHPMKSENTFLLTSSPAPVAPREPDVFDCCGNECGEACVWTIYRRAREKYEADYENWQLQQLLNEDNKEEQS